MLPARLVVIYCDSYRLVRIGDWRQAKGNFRVRDNSLERGVSGRDNCHTCLLLEESTASSK